MSLTLSHVGWDLEYVMSLGLWFSSIIWDKLEKPDGVNSVTPPGSCGYA